MVTFRGVSWIIKLLMSSFLICNGSADIISKLFTKTDLPALTLHLSGYKQLQLVSRKLDCAKQCSQDDACSEFYHTSLEHVCYLKDASSTHVYTIQAGIYTFYKAVGGSVGCPFNEGGWYELEKDSTVVFSLFTSTAVTFQQAVDHCASLDAHPLQIQSDAKMAYVKEKLLSCEDVKGHSYWVDATNALAPDPSSYDAYRTTDNKIFPISGGQYWQDPTGPNDGIYQPLCIWIALRFGHKLDDTICYFADVKHICEKLKT